MSTKLPAHGNARLAEHILSDQESKPPQREPGKYRHTFSKFEGLSPMTDDYVDHVNSVRGTFPVIDLFFTLQSVVMEADPALCELAKQNIKISRIWAML
jgi:hypothetical protein